MHFRNKYVKDKKKLHDNKVVGMYGLHVRIVPG